MIVIIKIVGLSNFLMLYVLVFIKFIEKDSFVHICRYMNLKRGEVTFIMRYFYEISYEEAKRVSFLSSAWGNDAKFSLDTQEKFSSYAAGC